MKQHVFTFLFVLLAFPLKLFAQDIAYVSDK